MKWEVSGLTNEEILIVLKRDLTPHRYLHTIAVAETAERLSKRFGVAPERAYLAGILHDCAKSMTLEDMVRLSDEMGVDADDFERNSDAIMHAPAGAARAEKEFGIRDREILSAVRKHTVGGTGLTQLEKLIYVSDFIEPNRKPFEGLEDARKLAETNLDEAAQKCAELSMKYVLECGQKVHPATEKMREETKCTANPLTSQ